MHKYFRRTDCPYYPCHDLLEINCLFCYCPLYHLADCGGDYKILKNNLKDCSECLLPHKPDNFEYIVMRYINDVSPAEMGRVHKEATATTIKQDRQPTDR